MISNKVATEIYLFRKRKGKTLIKPLKEKENSRCIEEFPTPENDVFGFPFPLVPFDGTGSERS